jgi:hypothetical protein
MSECFCTGKGLEHMYTMCLSLRIYPPGTESGPRFPSPSPHGTNSLISRTCRKNFCWNCLPLRVNLWIYCLDIVADILGRFLPVCYASFGMRRNQIYSKQSGGSDKDDFLYRYLSFHAEGGILWDWLELGLRLLP